MYEFLFQFKLGEGLPSLPGDDYFFVYEIVDVFGDYDLITAAPITFEDYGGL